MSSEMQIGGGVSAGLVNNTGLDPIHSLGRGVDLTDGHPEFGSFLSNAVGHVDALEQQARSAIDGLMRGTGVDVHQAMIAAEKANAGFELALAMRNKAIQCYQSIMSMQF